VLQVIQYRKTGEIRVEEVPAPQLADGGVLVENVFSLISAGTERTSIETAQSSIIGVAKSRPDLMRQVIQNVKNEGLVATYTKVQTRLDSYKELGYSSAGIVIDSSVSEFKPGDRVSCAGFAHHAEVIAVPKNLVARIPEGVSFEEAAFTTIGSIALQGVRQAGVQIGEQVAVIGLGLIGLMTVQLLKANGCRVIGLDISESSFDLARKLGCDACALSTPGAVPSVETFTKGFGADAVVITAATKSNEPIELALQFARKRSRVVIVGDVGMKIPRAPFYEKELELRIACSYGPGRYDPEYEEKGHDYPVGYVRWTENRNMEAVLELMAQRKLDVMPLITHRFPIREALAAYELITGQRKEKYIGVLIEYPTAVKEGEKRARPSRLSVRSSSRVASGKLVIGFIGAGKFAQSYLLPTLKKLDVELKGVATLTPVNAKSVAKKFKFEYCTSSAEEILADPEINTLFVATRHDSHAQLAVEALKRGKHVFVEKPLAVDRTQLHELAEAYKAFSSGQLVLLTGFNRRFSKPFRDMRQFFAEVGEPLFLTYRVNAGELPATHWVYDARQGGRVVGEACHFVDCMTFLTGARPVRVFAESVKSLRSQGAIQENVNVSIRYSNGSVGNLLYLTNGDTSAGKEYCEVHGGGRSALMNNFDEVELYRNGKRTRTKYDGTKGHAEEVAHFISVVLGKETLELSFEAAHDTTAATLKILESLQRGVAVEV
jgi:predicted dehydrogenase/threonine dehydrogenase-like Zn-dependent dehydrogenase